MYDPKGFEELKRKPEDIIGAVFSQDHNDVTLLRYQAPSEPALDRESRSESGSDSEPKPGPSICLHTFSLNAVGRDSALLKEFENLRLPALQTPAEDIHVVVSTHSGTRKAEEYLESLVKPVLGVLGLAEGQYQVVKTESEESVRELASGRLRERAQMGVAQTVILMAGDGGVVDLVNGLLSRGPLSSIYNRPTLFLIPLGTGNALFQSMSRFTPNPSSADMTTALRSLFRGSSLPLPLFRATFSPGARLLSNEGRDATPLPNHTLHGAIVASYGLHATLVADSDTTEWRKHGDKRFGLVARELLSPADGGLPHAYKARVVLRVNHSKGDGGTSGAVEARELERDEHGYVLLTLVSNLEKTFMISPASNPLDGKTRVVHFGPQSAEEVMRIMGLAYQGGKHVEDEKVSYEEVIGMKIQFRETGEEGTWRRACVDGTIVRLEEGGWMDVERVGISELALNVVTLGGLLLNPHPVHIR